MGRVRTKTVKKAARLIIEKHYPRLTLDFDTNKRTCDEVAAIPSKRLRNKIAGYVTHLMRRLQRGPVRGISFKLQEEERERRDNYVPRVSALEVDHVLEIDSDTQAMLRSIGMSNLLAGTTVASSAPRERRPRLASGMRVSFTTVDFGSEEESLHGAKRRFRLQEQYHLYGTIVLACPGQPRFAIYDDLPFLMTKLCRDVAPALHAKSDHVEFTTMDGSRFVMKMIGDKVHIQRVLPLDEQKGCYPCSDLLVALRACGQRFASFVADVAVQQSQWTSTAKRLRKLP